MRNAVLIPLFSILVLAGCHPELYDRLNPFENIKTVAVAPFDWDANIKYTKLQLQALIREPGDLFATELRKFEGFRVVPPSKVLFLMDKENISLETGGAEAAIELAEKLKVDAIIVGVITDCEPGGSSLPRLGVAIQLFTTGAYNLGEIDWSEMEQLSRPFAMPHDLGKRPIIAVDRVFDANNTRTRKRAIAYAKRHDTERGLGDEAYIKILKNYFKFVSYELISEIIRVEEVRQMIESEDYDEDENASSMDEEE